MTLKDLKLTALCNAFCLAFFCLVIAAFSASHDMFGSAVWFGGCAIFHAITMVRIWGTDTAAKTGGRNDHT